jgi:hypothetical protein
MKSRSALLLLSLLLVVGMATTGFAQETDQDAAQEGEMEGTVEETAEEAGPQFGFGVESIQYEGATWTRVRFFPVFPVWKFQFALDLELFINDEGEVSSKGWDFSGRDATLDTLARKIYYIQYNQKRNVTDGDDTLYAKVGSLDGVTLGSGMIMNSYRNTLDYPIEKKIGLEFALGNIAAVDVGMEGLVSDFTDFARGGGVLGARAFFSPLAPTDIPLLKDLEIGAAFAADVNQYGGLKDSDRDKYPDKIDRFPSEKRYYRDTDGDGTPDKTDIDLDGDGIAEYDELSPGDRATLEAAIPGDQVDEEFTQESLFSLAGKSDFYGIAGVDLRQPILPFLALYTGAAVSVDPEQPNDPNQAVGWGLSGPGVFLDFLPVISIDLGYRFRQGEFRFGYFNENYDNERAVVTQGDEVVTKDNTLIDETLNGVFGAVNANLYFINVYGSYEFLAPFGGGDNSMDLEARAGLNRERLAQIPVVSQYLDGLDAYYIHSSATQVKELFTPSQSVLMGAQLRFKLGESTVLSYDYQRSFDQAGEPVDQMTIGTQTSF